MSNKWTENQKRAIDISGTNALVSAGAGSGKTAVLVEHVISKITDENNPISVDKFLVVTFTKAAAAEMRERIYAALIKKVEQNPENTYIRKQISLLCQAQIMTMHSFCGNLIRNEFHRLGISADFEIGDTALIEEIKRNAMEEVLERKYEESTPDFLKLIDNYCDLQNDSKIIELIYNIYNFLCSIPEPEKWLSSVKERYRFSSDNGDFFDEQWFSYIIPYIKVQIDGIIGSYDDSISVIQMNEEIAAYMDAFVYEKNFFVKLSEKIYEGWNSVYDFIKDFEFVSRLSGKITGTTDVNSKYVQGIRNDAKNKAKKIFKVFSDDVKSIYEENNYLYPLIVQFCDLTLEFSNKFSELKLEKNVMDFNDLEKYTLELLSEKEYADSIKSKFYEILVDEYQDTNEVQSKIFETLSNGNNLFFVGDVKQSIYGFRNANPYNFTAKEKLYTKDENKGVKISLSHNFRSSEGVINFVNRVFSVIMTEFTGGIDYNDENRLICGNKDIKNSDCSVQIILSDSKDKDEDGLTSAEREAYIIAEKIRRLVNVEKTLIYDKEAGSFRHVMYRDIAVLVRKNNKADDFADYIASWGIPVYSEKEGGYFNTTEIAVIMAFLEIIDNPMQDIPLLAVLRSPMFGFTDNELAEIRGKNKKDNFYNCLKKSSSDKAEKFLNVLNFYIKLSHIKTVEQVIKKILTDTGYISFVGTLPMGAKRVANLKLLCKRASDFESLRGKSIAEFINYVKQIKESGDKYTSAKLMGENDNVVRIMTVHKSKGLEFPVVFVANCGGSIMTNDTSGEILIDKDLGLGIDIINSDLNYRYESVTKSIIAQRIKQKSICEEMRVLYVALTRAREMLFVTADISKPADIIQKYSAMSHTSNEYNVITMTRYIDWILYAVNGEYAYVLKAPEYFDEKDESPENSDDAFDKNLYDEIDCRLSYEYPYKYSFRIPSKMSVSEISGMGDEIIHLASCNFEDNGKLSAAERGTIIHFVMQNINLSNTGSLSYELDRMLQNGMLSEKQLAYVDVKAIENFFLSDIGKRLLSSDDVRREYKFFVEMPSEYVMGDSVPVNDETVIIQGVVDCFFIENGEIVILDYKTGKMNKKYQKQIKVYESCLEKATGLKVKETVIYPLI